MKQNFEFVMKKSVALDVNNHLYSVAFGIVDSENHESWMYFISKLKEALREVENLAFVSDRHAKRSLHQEMWMATYAFRKSEFSHHFEKIKAKYPTIAQYLEGIGFDRYNIMTSNYAKSFNNKTRDARSYPITTFVEETSEKSTAVLALTYEADLVAMAEKARLCIPYAMGQHEFLVLDGKHNGEVDLINKTYTCGVFHIIGIPYRHALCASLKSNVNIYSMESEYYKKESWRASYVENIYPCGNEDDWVVPDDIKCMTVRTLVEKNLIGRPKKIKQGRPKKKCHPPWRTIGDRAKMQHLWWSLS
ncbi:uncharacterized protein LOC133814733 [Humulus lupulus]|uniref:uncharacterized protein LOC133814733 n=1 Tax=Humulus lupulus TaxID=3486 RepID=UPI002B40212C|nr:uncharacterized protein LOC133814733 [Humulus lupulus]